MNTGRETEKKVFSYMEEHNMLKAGDQVVAGISGGADSVCLLFLLLEYAKRIPLSLTVVHVNHGIRKEAGEDARYVEGLCREHRIPFYLVEKDVRALAREKGCSEEEAGRLVRYESFAAIGEKVGADKIAVAHNCNDCSETMLFHLFRGSGVRGLAGIPPVRGSIIRPLLCLERREIEGYLTEKGIGWRRDCTNDSDDYTRNRIRRHILPYAEEEVAGGCVKRMSQSGEMLGEIADYVEEQARAALEDCLLSRDPVRLSVEEVGKLPPVLQKQLLLLLVKELSPAHRDISYVHIKALQGLFCGEGGRTVCLPFGIRGKRRYAEVVLLREGSPGDGRGDPVFRELPPKQLEENGHTVFLPEGRRLELQVLSKEKTKVFLRKWQEVPSNEYTKWFDYDKIIECMIIRTRKQGDYLTIVDGAGGLVHKSLKDYMITEKIPREERDRIPVLASGSHVLWLVGYRISEYYKITGNTKRILQVQLVLGDWESGKTEEKDGGAC